MYFQGGNKIKKNDRIPVLPIKYASNVKMITSKTEEKELCKKYDAKNKNIDFLIIIVAYIITSILIICIGVIKLD